MAFVYSEAGLHSYMDVHVVSGGLSDLMSENILNEPQTQQTGRAAIFLWLFVPSCLSITLIRAVQSLSRLALVQKLPYGMFFSYDKHNTTEELKRFGSLADFQQGALADLIQTSLSAGAAMLKHL